MVTYVHNLFLLFHTVPKIFWNETVYLVSEEDEAVQVVVSTNGEHLTPVVFQLVFTGTSAVGVYMYKTVLRIFSSC